MINGLHLGMLRGDIDLEDLGLVYPITIQNLVDDWEKVNNLMRYMISERRLMNFLLIEAVPYGADAYMLEIEAFRLLEDGEDIDRVSLKGLGLGLHKNASLELLLLVGSEEAFIDAVERMEEEGLSFEDIMEELQE